MATAKKRGKMPTDANPEFMVNILEKIDTVRPKTAEEIGVTPYQMDRLVKAEIARSIFLAEGNRGRPRKKYVLNGARGRYAMKSALRKIEGGIYVSAIR